MQRQKADDVDNLLTTLAKLTVSNGKAVARFGACLVVQSTFIEATLSVLSDQQRITAARMFRIGIEDAMSCTDDISMPGEYHDVMLEHTNSLLSALERRTAP